MRAAIVVLANIESHADMGRVANTFDTANEFHEAGDGVVLISRWLVK
jgi:hypothetical protein